MPLNFNRDQTLQVLPTRRERLADSFAVWELAGRGWQMFDYETELEPAFSRFIPPQRVGRPIDDGRVPGIFGRLFSNRNNANLIYNGDELSKDNSVQVQPASRPAIKTASFRIHLPNDLKISSEQHEQLLQTLAFSASFISFEIIGTASEIALQITCPETQKTDVFAQLKSHLPMVDLRESEDALRQNLQSNRTSESAVVDFGLGKAWFIPLPFGKSFATDTLLSLIASFDEIAAGETGCLQIVFCRVRGNWRQAVQEAIFDQTGKLVFANLQNHLAGIKEKLSCPLLAVAVRLAVQSESKEKSFQIARRTGAFFRQFSSPSENELIPLTNNGLTDENQLQSILNRTTYRTAMLLSLRECSSIFRLPSDAVKSNKLKRDENHTKLAPEFATQGNLVLGENHHAGKARKISLSSAQRVKHTHLIGSSGSGKSTLLMQMMSQDLESSNGFACFDPHGDLIDAVLERVPGKRLKDVILFDPADEDFPIGFNILAAHSELEKTLLASDLVSIFRRFSTSWGDVMNSILASAVLAFLESKRGGSLIDLKRFLIERNFREDFLKSVMDEEIRYYWQNEFPQIKGRPFAPLLTRLDTFLRSKLIRHIVAQKENRLDFRGIMDERKILLVRLSLGAIGEENAYLLGSLLVSKLYQATLSRQNIAEENRPPFFLYLDEAHHFVAESMNQILSGVRKYKLGLVLAHQQLRQFEKGEADVLDSVLSNCYTRVCFRLDDADAERLAKGFSFFTAEHLKNLGVGEAICRFEQSRYDFNLKTFPLEAVKSEVAEQRRKFIIEHTQKMYAKPKAAVEAELNIPLIIQTAAATPENRTKPIASKPPMVSIQKSEEKPEDNRVEIPIPPASEKAQVIAAASSDFLPRAEPTSGKGTGQHRYLQSLVKRMAESCGFLVTIEKEIFGGVGKIDVALNDDTHKIAVEISVTNDADYELQNIRKCLAANYSPVVMISADARHLGKIRRKAAEDLSADEVAKTEFLAPDEFHAWLENLETKNSKQDEKVKGFKVNVKLKPVDETGLSARKKAISDVVFGALKKLKNKPFDE